VSYNSRPIAILQEGFPREEDDALEVEKLQKAITANVTRHGGT